MKFYFISCIIVLLQYIGGFNCFCTLYASTSLPPCYTLTSLTRALHIVEMTLGGCRQVEECACFPAVVFRDSEHFHFVMTRSVVQNHASAVSLA